MARKSRFSMCLTVIGWLAAGLPAWAASQGSLTGSGDSSSLPRDLTAEGSIDWVYWYNSPPEHKSGGGTQFGSLTAINPNGGNQPGRCGGDPRTLTWSDGASTAISATGSGAGMCSSGASNGYSFTVAADTTPRTLIIHVGGGNASGLLTAHLSDGSAADYADTVPPTNNTWDHNYMLTYNAASAGQTLAITWTAASITALGGGVTISAAALRPAGSPLYFTGKVATQYSPAEMVLNGNLLYSCEVKWVSVVDVTDPANAVLLGTAPSSNPNPFNNDGNLYCAVQRGSLVAFVENLTAANGNGFVYFDLSTPKSPQLKTATKINKAAFEEPAYAGNAAFVPTIGYQSFGGAVTKQFGDVVAVDVTSFDKPAVVGTLEQSTDSVAGGAYNVFGATAVNNNTIYVATTSATGDTTKGGNNGTGQLLVVDVTNPAAMSVVKTLAVPGTVQLFKPVIQGNLAVAVGDSTGWNGVYFGGNLVVVTLDITDPRNPRILGSVTTNNAPIPSLPPPMASIGNSLFLVGARDAKNNNVLMQVDATDPAHPKVTNFMATYGAQRLAVSGTTLFASTDPNYFNGIGTYSLPKPISGGNSGSGGTLCTYTLSPASYAAPATSGPSTVNVTTQAGCAWTAVVQGAASWLHVNTGYAGTGTGTVNFSFDANSGAARSGTILIAAQAFTVNQASPTACSYSLSAASYSAASTAGQSTVNVTTQSGCAWTAAVQGSATAWLHIAGDSTSGTGSGKVTFSFDANTGAARSGTIQIGGQTFTVNQAAAPACTYTINPINAYVAYSGGSATVAVTTGTACAWTATSGVGWITITAGATGTGNGTVAYTAAANTTSAERTGNLTIAGQSFPVTEDGVPPAAAAPTLSAGGVVNAADYTPNFAPGMIISLFGSNFATAVTGASTIPLPNTLAGVSVEVVDGSQVLNAPLFFVSQLQINAQLPFNTTSSTVQVRVRNAKGVSNSQTIAITPRCPRLFTQTMDGNGDAIVVHADYTVVTANSPGAPGETLILFLTGLGAVSPSIAAGQAGGDGTAGKPLDLVTDPVTVTVGSNAATVYFKGLAPDYVGLYQINFQVPNSPIYGSEPITVSAGNQSSQSTATMSVGMKQTTLGSGTVGPQGGAVSGGPVTLTVPPGAFSSSTTINVSRVTGGAITDPSTFGDTYALSGVPASIPGSMTVAIQVSGTLPSGGDPYIVVGESDGGVLYVPAQVQGNLVTATLPPRPGSSASSSGSASPEALSLPAPDASNPVEQLLLYVILVKRDSLLDGHFLILYDVGQTNPYIPTYVLNTFETSYADLPYLELGTTPKTPITVRATGWGQNLREPWGQAGLTWGSTYTRLDTDWTPPQGYLIYMAAPELLIHAVLALNRPPLASSLETQWLDEAIAATVQRWMFGSLPNFIPPQVAQMFAQDWNSEVPFEVGMGDAQNLHHGYVESMFMNYLVYLGTFPTGQTDPGWPLVGTIYGYLSNASPMAALKAAVPSLDAVWTLFAEDMVTNHFYNPDTEVSSAPKLNILDVASHNQQPLSTSPMTLSWNAGSLAAKFYLINLNNIQWTSGSLLKVSLSSSMGARAWIFSAHPSMGTLGNGFLPVSDTEYETISPAVQNIEALLIAVVNSNPSASGNITVTLEPLGFPPPSNSFNFPYMAMVGPAFQCIYQNGTAKGSFFQTTFGLDNYISTPQGQAPVKWTGSGFNLSGQIQIGSSYDPPATVSLTGSVGGSPLTLNGQLNLIEKDIMPSGGTRTINWNLAMSNLACTPESTVGAFQHVMVCAVDSEDFVDTPSKYMPTNQVTATGASADGSNPWTANCSPDYSQPGSDFFNLVFYPVYPSSTASSTRIGAVRSQTKNRSPVSK